MSSWLVCLPAKCNTHTEYETASRVNKNSGERRPAAFNRPHLHVYLARICFAAIPGCRPGRALIIAGSQQTGRHVLVRARPVHQPARAAKAHCSGNPTAAARHRSSHPGCSNLQPSLSSTHQKPFQGRDNPVWASIRTNSTSKHLRGSRQPQATGVRAETSTRGP